MIKKALYALGVIAVLLGLYGFYSRLFIGERDVNYGSYVTWGLWVAMYLFFAGVATGAFMLATLDYLFNVKLFKGTGKYALWAALVTMPAALITIAFDLGHMERIWKVYLNPNFGAPMAQLVWGYTLFLIVVIVALVLAARKPDSLGMKIVMSVGLFLAIFLSGGVGALLGVNASRPGWHNGMLPAQFPLFSLTSGAALMMIVIGWFMPAGELRSQRLRALSIAMIVLILVKAYYLWTDFSLAVYSGVPDAVAGVNLILFGRYAWAFWGLQLFLGMIVPLVVLLVPGLSRSAFVVGLMGVFVLIGFAVARSNIIFPALAIPELKGLMEAFHGPHLNFDYSPSLMEWSVTIGVVGLSTLAFLIGTDRLPFLKRTEVSR
ncbi:MAG: NrfD/PsrC family molybdoenzyme membrane anchor subunit [Anaerolineae bacterium]|nr:polysulfide reductase NrfD [Candidatus Roseilinea sp.]MDW8451629.1 NrfD/PsrC family molybdoenzyme membrane anchor subunit [Anaerolineae bacterium]